ncbi:Gfo/Idh/MocA family protein [Brachybacterium hainanense]|uniref:Gfo/Idh/MocA family protein n=1 Tax=Brachybacterium hainanense TaxID=1541174 RepID=A0ABV6R6X3_9MICO
MSISDPASPRVAIVGTGGIARAHARALAQLPAVSLAACVDPVADAREAFAAEFAVPRRVPSLAELLEGGGIDVVHLCTPPSTHAPLALEALGAGVHVLCEKPSALSLSELDAIIAAERRSGARFATVFQHRFGPGGARLIELARSGRLGSVRTATCETLWDRPPAYFDPPWRGRWGTEGGGPTLGHGIHQIDLLLAALGPFTRICASARRQALPTNTEDVSAAVVEFASGAVATIISSLLSVRESSRLRIDLELASIEVEHVYGYTDADWRFTPRAGAPTDVRSAWDLPGDSPSSSHLDQFRAVYGALADGTAPAGLPVDSASARETLLLITALYQSAFTGTWVTREEADAPGPFHRALDGGGRAPWDDVKEEH